MKPTPSLLGMIFRMGLGSLLGYAGWEKLQAWGWWRDVLANMDVLPDASVGLFAAVLPGIELLVGALLVVGFWTRASALVTGGLFCGFAVVMCSVLIRDVDTICGCFGPDSQYRVSTTHVLMNLAYMTLSMAVFVMPRHRISVDEVLCR